MAAINHEALGHPTRFVLGPAVNSNDDQELRETYVSTRTYLGEVSAQHIARQVMLSGTEYPSLGPR